MSLGLQQLGEVSSWGGQARPGWGGLRQQRETWVSLFLPRKALGRWINQSVGSCFPQLVWSMSTGGVGDTGELGEGRYARAGEEEEDQSLWGRVRGVEGELDESIVGLRAPHPEAPSN